MFMEGCRPRRVLEVFIIVTYVLTFGLAAIGGFKIDFIGIAPLVALVCMFLMIGTFCTRFGMLDIRAGIRCVVYALLLAPPITLSTYLAVWLSMPLQDQNLAFADAALGFDWASTIYFVDSQPLLAAIFNVAYLTFSFQLLLWPLILAAFKHEARARLMVAGFAVICFLSSFISIWTPAIGTYAYYGFDGATLKNLDILYGYYFLDEFNAVREDSNFVWNLASSKGILTFPSVHVATGLLCAWAAWPLKALRYPAILLNVAMACSAVTSAGHYAIDVIAGCGVAMVSIAFLVWITGAGRSSAGGPEVSRSAISLSK